MSSPSHKEKEGLAEPCFDFELVTDEEFEALDAAVRAAEASASCSSSSTSRRTLRSCSYAVTVPEPLKEANHGPPTHRIHGDCSSRPAPGHALMHAHSHVVQEGEENVLCEAQKLGSTQAKDIEDIGSTKDGTSAGTTLKGRTAVRWSRRQSLGFSSATLRLRGPLPSYGVVMQTEQSLQETAMTVTSGPDIEAGESNTPESIKDNQQEGPALAAEVSSFCEVEECGVSQDTGAPLAKYRKDRGLSVTDITASEWCEQQVYFGCSIGEPRPTVEMVAGTARHTELEAEVAEVVIEVEPITREDRWAVRLLSTLLGLQMLPVKGLAREVYVLGEMFGVWLVGVIDELRLGGQEGCAAEEGCKGSHRPPLLVDTKTRRRPTPPSEAQKRNSRLQLMCYKELFDGLVSGETFTPAPFFSRFRLRPHKHLSPSVSNAAVQCGYPQLQTLDDVVAELQLQCSMTARSHDELLIRYEWQEDRSLLGQDLFEHEPEWMHERVERHLEWWKGLREAETVDEHEKWKCRYCAFSSICPAAKNDNSPPRVLQTTELRDVPLIL